MSGCRLVCIITLVGVDVKDGEAVHFTLDFRSQRCYLGMRLEKLMAIWAWIMLQSYRRLVRFFAMSIMARYSIFSRLSSVGNTDLVLVTLRSWQLKPLMALAV